MDKDNKSDDSKSKYLNGIVELTKNVDNLVEDLLQHLKSKDSSVLDRIRPIIEPKRNAKEIMNFYSSILDSDKKFKEINENIKKSGILNKLADSKIEIEDLESIKMFDQVNLLILTIDDLEKYKDIKIISKVLKEERKNFDNYIEAIQTAIFNSLERLPNVVDKIDIYIKFVLKYCDIKKFINGYIEICRSRLGFPNEDFKKEIILQRCAKLNGYLNMIKDLNIKIIGKKQSRIINDMLIKLIVLDLKSILATFLSEIEKDQSPFHIPFLIELYSKIRHSTENIVEEIESLFELKPELIKLMFNCFIQFFGELDLLEFPNKSLKSEKLTVLLANILNQFELCKDAKREWILSYGSSFGVYNADELNVNFCEKCLLKISELLKKLGTKAQSIYFINNINTLKPYFVKFGGMNIKELMYKNCEIIIGFLKVEIDSQSSPIDAYKYLLNELISAKQYFLPKEEREYVSLKLKQTVEDLISRKTLQGNPQPLLDAISEAYCGNK